MPQSGKKQDQDLSPQPSLIWDYYLHYSHFCAGYRHGDSHLTCSKPTKETDGGKVAACMQWSFLSLSFSKRKFKFDFTAKDAQTACERKTHIFSYPHTALMLNKQHANPAFSYGVNIAFISVPPILSKCDVVGGPGASTGKNLLTELYPLLDVINRASQMSELEDDLINMT